MPRWIIAAVLAAGAIAGIAAWAPWRTMRPRTPLPLDVYFTCDTSGRIEPCGCFSGQFGGLTRVGTVLKKAPASALIVEVGDALAGPEDYQVLQFGYLLRACGRIGYSAVNLGRREAKLSAVQLRDLAAASPVPLLSANVTDAVTAQPLVRPWLIVDKGGLKVGLVGVVDPDRLQGPCHPSVKVVGMTEALRRAVAEVRPNADILICLAFTDEAGMERLAREFYEFQIVLGGDVRQASKAITRINECHLFATTNQARALGEIHSVFTPSTARLDHPTGDIRLMVDTIGQDSEIGRISRDYRRAVRDVELAIDRPAEEAADRVPGVKPSATFVGTAACASCHARAFDTWTNTGHAHAFASLAKKESEADPSCIACHVVGFGEPGGYRRSMKAEQLTDVGCESCHGPGSEHVRLATGAPAGQPLLAKMRPVGAGQCTQCHHGEFSRPFTWDAFWPRIEHGKEPR